MLHLEHSVFGSIEPYPWQMQFQGPGEAEVTGVAPGEYVLEITEGANNTRTLTVNASSDQQIDSSTALPMAQVSGTVQGAPPAAPGTQTFLGLSQPGKPNLQAVNPDGTFEFKDLAPGSYEVVAQAAGRILNVDGVSATNATVEGHRVTLAGDQHATLTVTVTEGSTSVVGFARRDGKPVAGVMIVLVPADPDTSRTLFRRDQSDSDGSFSLPNVSPGSYTVIAIQDGWTLDWARSEVIARFLPKGQPVKVTAASGHVVKLALPVEVQPLEPAH